MKGTSAARIKYNMSPTKRNKWPYCNGSCIKQTLNVNMLIYIFECQFVERPQHSKYYFCRIYQ